MPAEEKPVRIDLCGPSIPIPSALKKPQLPIDTSFTTLRTLTENLSQSVTCPICLDHFCEPQQLQCGHIFCAQCITRMLAMDNARCAICKEKTGKRMIRKAPLHFDGIIEQLHQLQAVLNECDKSTPNSKPTALNDGYGVAANDATRARLQLAQQRYKKGTESHSEDVSSGGPTYKKCVLCPRGVDSNSFPESVPFGDIIPAKSDKKGRELFVHEGCAFYSEDVYEVDGVAENVLRTSSKTKKIVCGRDACGRTRANVKCAAKGCEKAYHFPCAVVENCVLVEDGYKMFCAQHSNHAPTIAEVDFDKAMTDPEGMEAQEHDDVCYLCDVGGRLLMCDTCERVTHPACSGLKAIPIGDWSCGVCTGAHPAEKPAKKETKRKRTEVEDPHWDPVSNAKRKAKAKRARKDAQTRQKFVLSTTRLNDSQKNILTGVAKMKKIVIRPDIDKRVTHLVISAYNKEEPALRTMKLCKAIAARVPIVCWKWVEESSTSQSWSPIDPHIHPLTWPKDKPAVFDSMRFYFGIYNGPKERREGLISLIGLGGGSVVNREPSVDSPSERDILYVRHDGENGATDDQNMVPTGTKIITTMQILDRCTKNR